MTVPIEMGKGQEQAVHTERRGKANKHVKDGWPYYNQENPP